MSAPIQPFRPPVGKPSGSRFATVRSTFALMLREMATRYGRSPGGYFWAVLEPLGSILILSIAFSLLLRNPSLGNSFILFYATGFLPFNMYSAIANTVSFSIPFSRALLFYPAVTWLDAILARFLLNMLTGLLVMIILLSGILALTDARIVINFVPIAKSIGLALLLGAGFGILNASLFGLFPVWKQIWGIATRPLMIASAVIYIYEDLPNSAQALLWFNPLVHVTGLARTGFFPTYGAEYVSIAYAASVGIIPLFFGILLMGRYHREILNSKD